MPLVKKTSLALLFLLIAGVVRMPFERPLARELRAEGVIPQPIDLQTSEALGQTSAAIALGGLRSLVAAVLNFSKVVPAWQDRDWLAIFDTFEQIHTLQPETGYYWEAAAGYAADDAYSDYRDRTGVPEWRRKLRRDEFFHKGETYLAEGIERLPDNIRLYQMKARIRADIYKPEHIDYAAATAVLDEAMGSENVTEVLRRYRLYLMSRVPSRRLEALQIAREIYQDPQSRFPSIKSLVFSLQNEFPNAPGERIADDELYEDQAEFLRGLFNHYQRREEQLPMVGVKDKIEEILAPMEVPYSLNPLANSDIQRITRHLERIYQICPLSLSEVPSETPEEWRAIVSLFQELGPESAPTIRVLYLVLQNLAPPADENRLLLSQIFPNKLYALRDLANFELDPSHQLPRAGVRAAMEEISASLPHPDHLDPLQHPDLFPLDQEWMNEVQRWQIEQLESGVVLDSL